MVAEAVVVTLGDDDVVEEAEAEQSAGFFDLAGEQPIFGAWRGVAGQMGMAEHETDSILLDGDLEQVAEFETGAVGRTDGDLIEADDVVDAVQAQRDHDFAIAVGQVGDQLGDVGRTAYGIGAILVGSFADETQRITQTVIPILIYGGAYRLLLLGVTVKRE
ncbi:MAG: hypothetical protein A2284_09180 [Deltaproteobacteria bacterium RIFOXYA12_FULL_61_11]|nr:MAG: hypothetical protein A2284_09180 [Deltaproteobacteria bacterium RIFOXYA12_FULL_61_11]